MVRGSALPGLAPAEGCQHHLNVQDIRGILWCSGVRGKELTDSPSPSDSRKQEKAGAGNRSRAPK